MLVMPIPTPVAKPDEDMVSTALLELFQFTLEVMSAVDLSEYAPIALNCWVAPIANLLRVLGVTVIEDSVNTGFFISWTIFYYHP
jgi:hypothetical protein